MRKFASKFKKKAFWISFSCSDALWHALFHKKLLDAAKKITEKPKQPKIHVTTIHKIKIVVEEWKA